jgi:hypothetical protein
VTTILQAGDRSAKKSRHAGNNQALASGRKTRVRNAAKRCPVGRPKATSVNQDAEKGDGKIAQWIRQ